MASKDAKMKSPSDKNTDIYTLAIACHTVLKGFEPQVLSGHNPDFVRMIDALRYRLNAWGNYLGVFAAESSFDCPMENDSTVEELIAQNLSQLLRNLQLLTNKALHTEIDETTTDVEPSGSAEELLHRLIYDSAERSIDRLERLGKTIRHSSIICIQQRVEQFANKDVNTLDETMFRLDVQNIFPLAAKSLIAYLGDYAFLTYARLEYRRKHRKELPIRRMTNRKTDSAKEGSEPTQMSVDFRQPIAHPDAACYTSQGTKAALSNIEPNSQAHKSVPSNIPASTFHEKPPGTPSNADSSIISSGIDYPRPPKTNMGGLTMCHICFECPKAEQFRDMGWWRRHVDRDLSPYVCLADHCTEVIRQFDSFDKWMRHMDNHSPTWAEKVHAFAWFCDEKHRAREFQNLQDAEAHMRKEHSDIYNDFQISSIAKRNIIQRPRTPGECPLCCRNILVNKSTTATGPHEKSTTDQDENENLPLMEQSLRYRKHKGKQARFESSISRTFAELNRDTDEGYLRRKPFEKKLADDMAHHVAEHLRSLAFSILRYLPLDGQSDDPSSTEDSASIRSNMKTRLSDDDYQASDTQNKGKGIANYSSSPIGDTYGVTPVKYEPRSNSDLINEQVEKLVSSDTDISSSAASRRDSHGQTDMMLAAATGDLEAIQQWLTVTDSTYISVKDNRDRTVLHHLIIWAEAEPRMSKDLREILSKIFDLAPQLLNGLDAMGRSPLYYSKRRFELFEILIKAGARVDKLTFNRAIEHELDGGTNGLVKLCLEHDAAVQWVDDRLKARIRYSKYLTGLLFPSRALQERSSFFSRSFRRDKK